jgi:hypothetical protein
VSRDTGVEPTPGPWFVRKHERDGELRECWVAAPDFNGFAYDAEILGDDEYRDGLARKLADCRLIAAAPELLEAAERMVAATEADQHFIGAEHDALKAAISKARTTVEAGQ